MSVGHENEPWSPIPHSGMAWRCKKGDKGTYVFLGICGFLSLGGRENRNFRSGRDFENVQCPPTILQVRKPGPQGDGLARLTTDMAVSSSSQLPFSTLPCCPSTYVLLWQPLVVEFSVLPFIAPKVGETEGARPVPTVILPLAKPLARWSVSQDHLLPFCLHWERESLVR